LSYALFLSLYLLEIQTSALSKDNLGIILKGEYILEGFWRQSMPIGAMIDRRWDLRVSQSNDIEAKNSNGGF
jgi:hypothetical protein